MFKFYLCQHLLHALLVSFDIFNLTLKTVFHLIFDQVNADSRLSVLDTLIVYPKIKDFKKIAQISLLYILP